VHLGPYTSGTSHTVGASNTTSASNTAGLNTPLATITFQGTNNIPNTRALASANFNPRACGSVGAIQPPAATYPKTPRDNLRTLELRSNIEAIGTAPGPPALQTPLCGSNIVALWKSCYKQQEDQIQALTQESNATTTIHTRDTRFLVFSTH
jgi:hypothetical protein